MRLDADGNIIATAGWELGGPGPMMRRVEFRHLKGGQDGPRLAPPKAD